ncbi:MAG: hypothetical protein H6Q71_2432 [Firmicutes bacterium]|nr:hypothetical protein [Bacillota bacterium]
MTEKNCSCGSKVFENINVTPDGIKQERYFTRCVQCGLVIATHGCESQGQCQLIVSKLLNVVCWMPAKLYHAVSLISGWSRRPDTEQRC